MIVYLWATVARETPVPYSSLGVSDSRERARTAAEHYLRSGQARLAFVETARTAMAACSFTPYYLPTGLGWWATADPAGEVTWARYTGPEVAAGLRQGRRVRTRGVASGSDLEALRGADMPVQSEKGVSQVDDPRAYMQVAHGLRERIEDGRLKPGDPMPSISQVCQESNRSRQTVGKALRSLEREGLIVRVHGLPYHVCDPQPDPLTTTRSWPESTAR